MDDRNLDDLLAGWRDSRPDESLSPDVRSALFAQVRELGTPSVTRVWRLALLGAMPVVAAATLLVLTARHEVPHATAGKLSAAKVDGQIVFSLANGTKQHKVYSSTDPRAFDPTTGVAMTANRFEVDATGGPALVFYRID